MLQHIIVTGCVAVGKSHISKILKYQFKDVVMYPEFIYKDAFAMELLHRRFNNTVSALTFQNFILDKWLLYQHENETATGIKIYERLPDDAVKVFAKLSLNEDEYKIQEERLKLLKLPSYDDMNKTNCTWIRYENNFTKDITPLIEAVKSTATEFCVIEVRSKTAFENYKHRNRKEEYYTFEEIEQLQQLYNEFTESQIKRIGCEVNYL